MSAKMNPILAHALMMGAMLGGNTTFDKPEELLTEVELKLREDLRAKWKAQGERDKQANERANNNLKRINELRAQRGEPLIGEE
jgi:hypothetical protein